ncbi:energy-coupling factor transporter transmembrane protein EcfT [Pantoea coffeiphila]|nr:energy-coupling factor transporter transmembrane protein EcfT [Pantoea coffeiphila]
MVLIILLTIPAVQLLSCFIWEFYITFCYILFLFVGSKHPGAALYVFASIILLFLENLNQGK